MKKKLIDEFETDLKGKVLPLTLHFATNAEDEDLVTDDVVFNVNHICVQRYGTNHYVSKRKFYKPISRTLDV